MKLLISESLQRKPIYLRRLTRAQKYIPKLTKEDLNAIDKWSGVSRGIFKGDEGKFWLDLAKKIPKSYKNFPSVLYRGINISSTGIKTLLKKRKVRLKKKAVLSWARYQNEADKYAERLTNFNIVLKESTSNLKPLVWLSRPLIKVLTLESGPRLVEQDEVITIGTDTVKIESVLCIRVSKLSSRKLLEELSGIPCTLQAKAGHLFELSFKNKLPYRWKLEPSWYVKAQRK